MRQVCVISRLVILVIIQLCLSVQLELDWVEAVETEAAKPGEWAKVVKAAKKEGRVVLYAGAAYVPIFQEFQKKYPQIKVVTVPGRMSQFAGRLMAERRAGKYLVDLILGGSGSMYNVFYKGKVLDPIKPALILPEIVDGSKWWSGRHIYHDDESRYILSFNGVVESYFSYNTKLVNPNEFKSYWDFLKPKWEGRIVIMDPVRGGGVSGALQSIYHNPKLGPKYLRRFLGKKDLIATRDTRLIVDWLARGKFAIAGLLHPGRADIFEATEQGLPVNVFDARNFKEGIPLGTSNGNMALINMAPHPNAAKVAINWFLSREGQMVFQKVNPEYDSLRIDIPKDGVLPALRRKKGVDYLVLAGPGFKNMVPVNKIINEVWKKKRRSR